MENKRLYGIDLIKTVAIIFVVCVHFFLNAGYYNTVMSGKTMLISTVLRWLFFTCVPLFLIATGFLRCKKEVSKKYYFSLFPIYISYILAAVIGIFVKYKFTDAKSLGFGYDFLTLLSFKNGYAWYLEMFLGLAVLIPFINLSYNNIKEKSHKLVLISLLIFITGICSLNIKFENNGATFYLFSDYWVILYPFTYYLIGAYIREYRPKINKIAGLISLLLIILAEGFYTYISCKDKFFDWSLLGGNGGVTVLVSSALIFLLLYDIKIENKFIRKIVTEISSKTLDIYLISYSFDLIVYKYFLNYTADYLDRVKYAPLVALIVFAIAFLYSKIKELILGLFKRKNREVLKDEALSNI